MKNLNLFFIPILIFFLACCAEKDTFKDEDIERVIENIKITEEEVTLNIGDSHELIVKHYPEDLKAPKYLWTSSNENIATINTNGKISALSIGTTDITVEAKDLGFTSVCQVNVIPIEAASIKLSESEIKLIVGDTHQLSVIVEPDNATYKDVIWTSSNEEIATVLNGNITALKEGNVTITAQLTKSKLKANCELTISRKIVNANYNIDVPGTLESILKESKATITDLTLSGNLDARDLITLKEMEQLHYLDFNNTKIHEFKINDLTFNSDELIESNFAKSKLEYVSLPKDLKTIPDNAFSSCSNLKDIVLPSTMKIIKESAFSSCNKLNTIILPEGLIRIEDFAFVYTHMMGKLIIPNTVTYIGRNTFQYTSFDEVQLSSNLSTISIQLFHRSNKLKKIIIPEGPTKIEGNAFGDCESLEYVEIPSSIKEIEMYAFNNCPIVEIHINNPTPPTIQNSSSLNIKDKSKCKIYVPKGSSTAYKLSPFWNEFKNFIEIE